VARKSLTVIVTAMLATCVGSTALADDVVAPLGLYLGGAIGRANDNSSLSCLFDSDHTDTRFAYDGGVQFKISRLGLRAEYERISARGGDPSLLSLGAIWTF
jgi:hypothetical protein